MNRSFIASALTALTLTGCVATREDVAGLEHQVIKLQENLTALETKQAALSSKLDEIQKPVESLNSNLNDTQNLLSNFAGRFDDLQSRMATLQASFAKSTQELDDNLATMQDNLSEEFAKTRKSPTVSKKASPATAVKPKSPLKAPGASADDADDTPAAKPSPLTLFEDAYKDFLSKKWDTADAGFANYLSLYPEGSVADKSLYYRGLTQKQKGDSSAAKKHFEDLLVKFPKSPVVRAAMLEKAKIFLAENKTEEAEGMLEYLVMTHPQSKEAMEAKEVLKRFPSGKH
ncbi:MAG: tetratricopeptide repeat protein [Elusimicrobiota bacterium]